jgi:hypothetical protein
VGDDAKVRARRARAHKRGDHSLCHPERCKEIPRSDSWDEGDEPELPEAITAAVRAHLEALAYPEDDPRHVMGLVAMRLARAIDQAAVPRPEVVRELRLALAQMADAPTELPTKVDELRAARLRKHAEQLLDGLA